MRYCVEVHDDGDTEIWRQEAALPLASSALLFNNRGELLDELISYGVEETEAKDAITQLDDKEEHERIAV